MVTQNFGKIENGEMVYAPTPLSINGIPTWTNDPAIYAVEGYLPIVHSDMPERDGYWYELTYQVRDGVIVQTWVEHEIPQTDEISDSEALSIITGGTA